MRESTFPQSERNGTKLVYQPSMPKLLYFLRTFFSSIRYHGHGSSSLMSHVCHHVGGVDTHPWSATKGQTKNQPLRSRPIATKNSTQKTQLTTRVAETFLRRDWARRRHNITLLGCRQCGGFKVCHPPRKAGSIK